MAEKYKQCAERQPIVFFVVIWRNILTSQTSVTTLGNNVTHF